MAGCSIISCPSNISIGGYTMSKEPTETATEDITKTCLNPLLNVRNHALMGATDSLDQVISVLCYLSLLIKKSLGEESDNAHDDAYYLFDMIQTTLKQINNVVDKHAKKEGNQEGGDN